MLIYYLFFMCDKSLKEKDFMFPIAVWIDFFFFLHFYYNNFAIYYFFKQPFYFRTLAIDLNQALY